MKKLRNLFMVILSCFILVGCAGQSSNEPVLIYTNADEETVTTFSKTLDENGFEGQYEVMNFGSSELAAKLATEGKDTKADILSFSTFHLETLNDTKQMLVKHGLDINNVLDDYKSEFYTPNLGFSGTIFYNTKKVEEAKLPIPKSIKDLANPVYKGKISFPSLAESTTGWLLIQAILDNYEKDEAIKIIAGLKENAGVHIESSGSSPLKKVESGEIAIGFGIRHQALAKKEAGAQIEIVNVSEGNYVLTESYALTSDNAKAKEMMDVITFKGRSKMIKLFPTPLFKGEPAVKDEKVFSEKLTKGLLDEHIKLFESAK